MKDDPVRFWVTLTARTWGSQAFGKTDANLLQILRIPNTWQQKSAGLDCLHCVKGLVWSAALVCSWDRSNYHEPHKLLKHLQLLALPTSSFILVPDFLILMHKILCNSKSSLCYLLPGRQCHVSDASIYPVICSRTFWQERCNTTVKSAFTHCQPLLLLPPLHRHARVLLSLPHKAAQRTSELNFFLYFRISGLSLWGRIFVGLTLTTEPFRAFSLLTGSGFALDARMKDTCNYEKCKCLATSHLLMAGGKKTGRDEKRPQEHFTARAKKNQAKHHTSGKFLRHSWLSTVVTQQQSSGRRTKAAQRKFRVMQSFSFCRCYWQLPFPSNMPCPLQTNQPRNS